MLEHEQAHGEGLLRPTDPRSKVDRLFMGCGREHSTSLNWSKKGSAPVLCPSGAGDAFTLLLMGSCGRRQPGLFLSVIAPFLQ